MQDTSIYSSNKLFNDYINFPKTKPSNHKNIKKTHHQISINSRKNQIPFSFLSTQPINPVLGSKINIYHSYNNSPNPYPSLQTNINNDIAQQLNLVIENKGENEEDDRVEYLDAYRAVNLVNYSISDAEQLTSPKPDFFNEKTYLKQFMQRTANRINLSNNEQESQMRKSFYQTMTDLKIRTSSPSRNSSMFQTQQNFNTFQIRKTSQKVKEFSSKAAKRIFLNSVLKKQKEISDLKQLNLDQQLPKNHIKIPLLKNSKKNIKQELRTQSQGYISYNGSTFDNIKNVSQEGTISFNHKGSSFFPLTTVEDKNQRKKQPSLDLKDIFLRKKINSNQDEERENHHKTKADLVKESALKLLNERMKKSVDTSPYKTLAQAYYYKSYLLNNSYLKAAQTSQNAVQPLVVKKQLQEHPVNNKFQYPNRRLTRSIDQQHISIQMNGVQELDDKSPVQKRSLNNQGSFVNLNPIYAPRQ